VEREARMAGEPDEHFRMHAPDWHAPKPAGILRRIQVSDTIHYRRGALKYTMRSDTMAVEQARDRARQALTALFP
jgi:hypothetical protein